MAKCCGFPEFCEGEQIAMAATRVTISENFASYAAVQEPVDVKPDRACPEILGHRMLQVLQCLTVVGNVLPDKFQVVRIPRGKY